MAYRTMKKLIENQNNKLKNGSVTKEDYEIFKTSTMNKLDTFLACDRLTASQYEELVGMMA